jgi:hypothetical protein
VWSSEIHLADLENLGDLSWSEFEPLSMPVQMFVPLVQGDFCACVVVGFDGVEELELFADLFFEPFFALVRLDLFTDLVKRRALEEIDIPTLGGQRWAGEVRSEDEVDRVVEFPVRPAGVLEGFLKDGEKLVFDNFLDVQAEVGAVAPVVASVSVWLNDDIDDSGVDDDRSLV